MTERNHTLIAEVVYLDGLRNRMGDAVNEIRRVRDMRKLRFSEAADDQLKEAISLLLNAERAIDLAHGSELCKEETCLPKSQISK